MVDRVRRQDTYRPKGQMLVDGVNIIPDSATQLRATHLCQDLVGPGDNGPLNVEHYSIEGGVINSFSADHWAQWHNYAADGLDQARSWEHLGPRLGEDKSNQQYAVTLAARTNPSRPYVDIPINVLQLGEITRLIQRRGRDILRNIGRENLRYQFGIAPLVGDLVKLTNFQEQLSRRMQMIDSLAGSTGLRRTMDLGRWSNTTQELLTYQSHGGFMEVMSSVTTTQRVRGHIRWLPDVNFRSMSVDQRQSLAVRATLGLTIDPSTLWELIPFSWLADWGTNVGEWFTAHRNIIPAHIADVTIMRETRTERIGPEWIGRTASCSGCVWKKHSKTREPTVLGAPSAHMPLLSGNQMGILASLYVTRR